MIRNYTEESIALLREMIAIPSPSFEEEAVSLHVSSFLTGKGIVNQRVKNNIVAFSKNFDPSMKTLMLCAHLDTVQPAAGYDFDPYNPDLEKASEVMLGLSTSSDLIPGLGANDDGASVVAMIAAFRALYDVQLPVNLMLVLSTEEERSGVGGMRHIWDEICAGRLPKPDFAIVGEPTGMRAATAERGLLVIDAHAKGVSGHAARGEGVNAIYIAIEDIRTLQNFKFEKVSPTMGEVRLSVTQINAGTAHNVIPEGCSFVVDIRPTEVYSNAEIMDLLQAQCQSRLVARNLSNRSSATPSGSILLECAAKCGIETFVSPTTSDWMRIGCDAIKMGPGDSSRSHRKNEYVTTGEIAGAVEKYVEFIQEMR